METELKILPKAIDLEQAVLGAMLIDSSSVGIIIDVLHEEVFFEPRNREVFSSIKRLFSESKAIDMLTVSSELKRSGKTEKAGGVVYPIELSQKVASSAHIEYHSRILIQTYIQRSIIVSSQSFLKEAYKDDVDVFKLLDKTYDFLNNISELAVKKNEVRFSDIVDYVKEKGKKIYRGEITPGLITPIKKLTNSSGGWRNGELIILAARPGMGKTAFALKAASTLMMLEVPTAFFCLEMSKETLVSRIISMENKIPLSKFNKEGINDEDEKLVDRYHQIIKSKPLLIDDTTSLSIEQLQIKAQRLKSVYGIKILIVDYLQLMTSSSVKFNREQEISKISRGLKTIAKDLNIPVIALSQLSRAVESRGGTKRPLLSDLRESGAIEQDADMVGFLYRPEYYGMTEWDEEHTSCLGEAEYIVAKNRNGGLVRARMKFEAEYTLFSDLEKDENFQDQIQGISPEEAF
ncbi:replicative DNA helicase [Tenacibaculum sp. SZ-18]|uniref:replicative DNA helicase n=1 Tax=Tenacibaculum sp. SZ-18 TaxID=754423 RepID=UPI000C2D51CC|nr:replicative DNA helicase [Tenacibaculum sp. SZ-18]AUC15443.1 replicative DNA helicase [Tenacibaculum sp. SZ-18]